MARATSDPLPHWPGGGMDACCLLKGPGPFGGTEVLATIWPEGTRGLRMAAEKGGRQHLTLPA